MQFSESNSEEFSNFFPKALTGSLVVQETDKELLVYDLEANRALCLNNTARLVWQYCDGKSNLSVIAKKLEKKIDASVDSDLVLFALNQLNKEGLISNGKSMPSGFGGLSRREIVKKIGFGSLIALPIVSAIVAPKAVNAQSLQCAPGTDLPGISTTCFGPDTSFCQGNCSNQLNCCSGTFTISPNGNPPGVCNQTVLGCRCTCD